MPFIISRMHSANIALIILYMLKDSNIRKEIFLFLFKSLMLSGMSIVKVYCPMLKNQE